MPDNWDRHSECTLSVRFWSVPGERNRFFKQTRVRLELDKTLKGQQTDIYQLYNYTISCPDGVALDYTRSKSVDISPTLSPIAC